MEGEVKITFVYGGKATGDNKTAVNTKTGKLEIVNEPSASLKTASTFAYVSSMKKLVRGVKSILTDEALYESEKFFDLTDNVQAKRNLNIAKQNIQRVSSLAMSTYAGAKTGGWVGAIVGFGVGTAKSVVDIYQGYDQQAIAIKQKEEQLEYTRQKVGYSLTAGINGENR